VFWSKTPESRGEVYAMLVADAPEEVRDLLLSPVAKKAEPPRAFYMLTLTGTKGRVLVRDFMETTVGEVKKHVTRWFKAQRHLDAWGEEGKPLKIFPLVASCYADKKEIQPRTIMAMWNTALKDQPPPNELLIRAVSRCRVEGDKGHVTRPRAALVRVMLPYTAKGGEIMRPSHTSAEGSWRNWKRSRKRRWVAPTSARISLWPRPDRTRRSRCFSGTPNRT
jgi:CRISPR-associated protein Csd1